MLRHAMRGLPQDRLDSHVNLTGVFFYRLDLSVKGDVELGRSGSSPCRREEAVWETTPVYTAMEPNRGGGGMRNGSTLETRCTSNEQG